MQREHRPYKLGPAIFRRGRWYAADMRPWGGGRPTLRDPAAPGWPRKGERTEEEDIAERWKWSYVEDARDTKRRRLLRLGPKARRIGEQIEAYLEHRERVRIEPRTIGCDATALRVHLLGQFPRSTPTDEIDRAAIQERLVDRLLGSGYQRSSVQRTVHALGAFFEWCGFAGDANPGRQLTLPAKVHHDVRAWSDEEMDKLRAAAGRLDRTPFKGLHCPFASFRRALEFALASGGRQRELLAAEEGGFRYGDRTYRYTVQLGERGTGTKALKGKRSRTALMLPFWWDWHHPTARSSDRIICWRDGADGHTLSTSYLWIQQLYDAAKINFPGAGWHTLRHTYARMFIEMGGRLEELQKSLGHQSIVTTETVYGHFHEDQAALLARQRIYRDGAGPRILRAGAPSARA